MVTDSYKYGSEVQFISYSRKAPELKRRVDKDHGYYRLEYGYLPGTHEAANLLRYVADQIDTIIGYCDPVVTYSVKTKNFTEKVTLQRYCYRRFR